mgnify:CR=1 FL=1
MVMKKLVVLLIASLPFIAFGQSLNSSDLGNLNTDFDMSVGTSFSSFGGNGSSFVSYAFPKMRMRPTDNLEIQGGVLMMNTQMSGMSSLYAAETAPQMAGSSNFTNAYAYAAGTYQLSDNLKISGSAYKKVDGQNQMQQQIHPQAFNFDAYGMQMRMEYKISENAKIDAQFNFNKGYSPFNTTNSYYSNPFYRQSPFGPY